MAFEASRDDRFGLVHPAVDAHTLGVSCVQGLLEETGHRVVVAGAEVCEAAGSPESPISASLVTNWIAAHRITVLGFSYRLDPEDGARTFQRLFHRLKEHGCFAEQGGPLRAVFFAGLPQACRIVRERVPGVAGVFAGDETPSQTLRVLGVEARDVPNDLARGIAYDEARLSFGRDLIRRGEYRSVKPVRPRAYPGFGTEEDTLVARLWHNTGPENAPLMRAHVGPYLPDRAEAVRLMLDWTRQLAASGFLDVLSIGTSQLTQSEFGRDWTGLPNGGGVPIHSPEELAEVWRAARPMLVRTYAGTRNVPALARMYEERLHIAWHALSFWWFSRIDGRGPNSVRENLRQHLQTARYVASTGKPLEANVPHHFAFRGADDVTYVVSAYLAAKAAKNSGIRYFILQNMLNTPKYTWGVQDLAKSRAMLQLVRGLWWPDFHVILQPRGGLDYFSADAETAKAQLAAVSALMDDIEPDNSASPPVVHVVSYSEGTRLADPAVVDESIQITRHAISEYRRLREKGDVDDMTKHPEVEARTTELVEEAQAVIRAIEERVPDPYGPEGLYEVLARGFLPVPYLWECREEFAQAVRWRTRVVRGAVKLVDEGGTPLTAARRVGLLPKSAPTKP